VRATCLRGNQKLLQILNLFSVLAVTFGLMGAAQAQTVKEILTFPGYTFAFGGLAFDSAGNLYGTTNIGGTGTGCGQNGCGTVFALSPTSSGGWTETVLYNFTGGSDGANPLTGVVIDAAGNLYGTTRHGGSATCVCGNVYRLSPVSGGGWKETVLYSFTGGSDGSSPEGTVVLDSKGNIYGTTYSGGNSGCFGSGCGVVFKLSPTSNGAWSETVLHTFTGGIDGSHPLGSLALQGNTLYGAAAAGGILNTCNNYGCGVVFKIARSSTGWKETVLYRFTGGQDGSDPVGGITLDSSGNLVGTTNQGGSKTSQCSNGCGLAFKLTPSSTGWREIVLYRFTHGNDGAFPVGPVTLDAAGNVFGETISPSWCNSFISICGVVYKLSWSSAGWQPSALYQIPGDWNAVGSVVLDAAGNIFGMGNGPTETGISGVFEITP